ncbi:ABC transporter permease [Ilumatobacter sp.]|uniref:ABC transporter permease n=1 Tax=Ilumatobacter sp. TaxID=1967498 RepID=UPI003B5264B2
MAMIETDPVDADAPATVDAVAQDAARSTASPPIDADGPATAGSDRAVATAPASWPVRARRTVGDAISRWWAVAAVVAVWQLWVQLADFNSIVLPTPVDVVRDIVAHPGAYAGDTARTLVLALLGITAGMGIGIGVAVAAWASPILAGATGPLVLMLRSIPIVAVIPVIARVVGYGNQVVPVVTVLLAFFPAYVMTTSGLRSASPASLDVFAALGAGRSCVLRRLLAGSAMPNIAVALRLSASTAVLAAMVAEFLSGTTGLGRLFSTARTRFDNERAWGAALIATVASVLFFQLSLRIERGVRRRYR